MNQNPGKIEITNHSNMSNACGLIIKKNHITVTEDELSHHLYSSILWNYIIRPVTKWHVTSDHGARGPSGIIVGFEEWRRQWAKEYRQPQKRWKSRERKVGLPCAVRGGGGEELLPQPSGLSLCFVFKLELGQDRAGHWLIPSPRTTLGASDQSIFCFNDCVSASLISLS